MACQTMQSRLQEARSARAHSTLTNTLTRRNRFIVAAHTLKLSEQNDLFYSGDGAQNRRVSFGYVGRSSNGAQPLANVVETSLSHTFNKYFSGNVYYGHAFGNSVIERFFRGQSHADYFFADLTARF